MGELGKVGLKGGGGVGELPSLDHWPDSNRCMPDDPLCARMRGCLCVDTCCSWGGVARDTLLHRACRACAHGRRQGRGRGEGIVCLRSVSAGLGWVHNGKNTFLSALRVGAGKAMRSACVHTPWKDRMCAVEEEGEGGGAH